MNPSYQKITGVIMAGGKSKRMGTDKGLVYFNGKPLIEYGLELFSSFFTTIFISTNNLAYNAFGFPLVTDIYADCGPLGGLYATLEKISTDYVFILSCDMPLMNSSIVARILENARDFEIVIPIINGKTEPLCGIYSKSLLPEVKKRISEGNYKMQSLIHNSKTYYVEFEPDSAFANVNSAEDLKSLTTD